MFVKERRAGCQGLRRQVLLKRPDDRALLEMRRLRPRSDSRCGGNGRAADHYAQGISTTWFVHAHDSVSLKRESRSHLERPWTTRQKRLTRPLCRLTERVGLGRATCRNRTGG